MEEDCSASSFTDEEIRCLQIQLQNPMKGVRIHDYKWKLRTYTQCFTGEEVVRWLLDNTRVKTEEEAEALGQKLLQTGAFRSLSSTFVPFQSSHHLFQLNTAKDLEDMSYLDELLKEYLLYRGLTDSLLAFESELKQDRLHQFEGARIVQKLLSIIQELNLNGFLEFWKYLQRTLFAKLDYKFYKTVTEFEFNLQVYYLVTAIQTNRTPRVHEFFRERADHLSPKQWSIWFSLPYVNNPQDHAEFGLYFTKQWIEHLSFSLSNFVSTCLHQSQLPRLLLYNIERATRKSLEMESDLLKSQLEKLKTEHQQALQELNTLRSLVPPRIDQFKVSLDNLGGAKLPSSAPILDNPSKFRELF